MIETQLKEVQRRMEEACRRAGRDPKDVTLIAVSKTKPLPLLMEAYGCGVREFGENKVQEIMEKAPQMPQDARFHMIGHLQRNKVKQVLKHAVLIHSVDSVRLAEQTRQKHRRQARSRMSFWRSMWRRRRVRQASCRRRLWTRCLPFMGSPT